MHLPLVRICGLLVLCFSGAVCAQEQNARTDTVARSVELALSDETGEIRYRSPTDLFGQPGSEAAYAVFLSEERDVVASASLLFGTDLNFGPLRVRLGPQAYAALLNEENNDVFALSIGAQVRYDFIPSRRIALVGVAYWSPDILTFGSADTLTDFSVRGEMGIAERLTAFVGYRWFELDLLMRQDRTLQNELFAGINWELR